MVVRLTLPARCTPRNPLRVARNRCPNPAIFENSLDIVIERALFKGRIFQTETLPNWGMGLKRP